MIGQIEKFAEPICFAYVVVGSMAETEPTLIAIGGGGATHGTHPELDRICLSIAGEQPRIGYIGKASGDDPEKFQNFLAGFQPFAAEILPLPSDADADQARNWVGGLDLIYVGGGNPIRLVDHWNASGVGAVLLDAAQGGTALAGVSAGAMCWFESFLWRSERNGLQVSKGLGLVQGAMTPHSLIEPDRRTHMLKCVGRGEMAPGYAVDDGAALVIRGDTMRAYPPKGPPNVYRIHPTKGETPLSG